MTSSDQETIRRQLKILSKLWDDVLFQTKLRLRHLIELLENLEKFEEIWKLLDRWLTMNETSLMRQIRVAGSAQKQKEHIQKLFMNELERYEHARKRLQGFAVHFVSACPNAPFSEHIRSRQQNINLRWEALCRELGMSYKKVEETLFSLQLFEAMLTRLNDWLGGIEGKAYQFISYGNDVESNRQLLMDIKVCYALAASKLISCLGNKYLYSLFAKDFSFSENVEPS